MPALPPNSLIAITGVTGYIASYTGLYALRAGHRVRGTVRSIARAEALKAAYAKHGIPTDDLEKRLEFAIVDDLNSEEQLTNALRDVDGVLHGALAFTEFTDPKLVDIAVEGTLVLLRVAKKFPSIKRVVLTSSIVAIHTPPAIVHDRVLSVEDWNDEAVNMFENNLPVDHDPRLKRAAPFIPYSAAKLKAERAAWDFVKQESPKFDLVAILPATNIGPMLYGEPASTTKMAASGLYDDQTVARFLPNQWFVDVRDTGRLQFLAFTTPAMAGKRYLAAAEPFKWNQIYAIYRKNFPSAKVPEDFEEGEEDVQKLDISPSTEVLGEWIGLEQSLVDLGRSLGF
ncbi:hypothetical protein JB92DRAFT_3059092 [Gautieria morchelliformis]|nr:hypothetical protein JB92DRAFT_3059092 [Gautieria morchelliformis]